MKGLALFLVMHILYIHQYYRTPEQGGCVRSYHLSQGMAEAGYRMTILTGADTTRIEKHGQVEVRYLKVPYRNDFGFLKRTGAFLLFVWKAKKEIKTLPKADLAYVVTTPLSTGLIALHLKKNHQIPYIFEVGDLWPEAPVQMGVLRNPFLKKILYRFEARCYQEAQQVIALSPAIQHWIQSRTPGVEVVSIPNFSNNELFRPSESRQKDLVFHIGYIGTFGKANNLKDLILLAKKCEQEGMSIHFHLMGEGAFESSLRSFSQSLSNITFYPFGSQTEVKRLLDQLDAVYVSFDPGIEILNTGSPNKFFDGLAAGKLIIINFHGWLRELIELHRCGFYHRDPEDFIRKIQPFIQDEVLLRSFQKNARRLAEQEFDKDLLVKKTLSVIG